MICVFKSDMDRNGSLEDSAGTPQTRTPFSQTGRFRTHDEVLSFPHVTITALVVRSQT